MPLQIRRFPIGPDYRFRTLLTGRVGHRPHGHDTGSGGVYVQFDDESKVKCIHEKLLVEFALGEERLEGRLPA